MLPSSLLGAIGLYDEFQMPFDWYGASNVLPGFIRAYSGPERVWVGNGKCSSPAGCASGAGARELATSEMLQAQPFPTGETHQFSLASCSGRIGNRNINL